MPAMGRYTSRPYKDLKSELDRIRYPQQFKTESCPPKNLIPTQPKSDLTGSQVKRLTKDMKNNGFNKNNPVDVWRNPKTGRLEIQDGHHRTEAAKKAGLNNIPIKVWR